MDRSTCQVSELLYFEVADAGDPDRVGGGRGAPAVKGSGALQGGIVGGYEDFGKTHGK